MKKRDHVTAVGDGGLQDQGRGVKVLELLMPWLSPRELANLARTCRPVAIAVRSLTQGRVADAAQGLERWPVPVRNDLDSCRYPWFRYTPSCCRPSPSNAAHRWCGQLSSYPSCNQAHRALVMRRCQEDLGIFPSSGILISVGCRCADSCVLAQQNQGDGEVDDITECTCGRTSDRFKLQLPEASDDDDDDSDVNEDGAPLIVECGGACSCSADCCLRVTQRGLSVRAVVVRQRRTGWGLHAAQHISKGSFVCEYAGELLTTAQSRERQSDYDNARDGARCGSALLVVREFMPSGDACVRLNVDATRVGNVARFINHACDGGNLVPCLARAAGSVIPRLVLFARREIHDGEEMRYSYGSCGGVAGKALACHCGTAACFGTLPSDSI